jgi:hypothetical protein
VAHTTRPSRFVCCVSCVAMVTVRLEFGLVRARVEIRLWLWLWLGLRLGLGLGLG